MGVRRLLLRRQVIKCSVMAETERVGKAERFCRGKILRIWPWIGLWEMRETKGSTWSMFVAQVNMRPEQSLVNHSIGNHGHKFCKTGNPAESPPSADHPVLTFIFRRPQLYAMCDFIFSTNMYGPLALCQMLD